MSDTVVVPQPPSKPLLAVPILPQEQIAHAMHAMAMMEATEYELALIVALTKPLGAQRANHLAMARSKLVSMQERLEKLIAENTKLVVPQ